SRSGRICVACTIKLAGWIGDLLAGRGDGGEVGYCLNWDLWDCWELWEGILFSFELFKDVIFLTMYNMSSSRSH
ncbi:MAG: hypothetical protein JNK69_11830, partial [Saprospiraceae bacterium]|nr:hypothetical protein [Saprospiraceae bacterium]